MFYCNLISTDIHSEILINIALYACLVLGPIDININIYIYKVQFKSGELYRCIMFCTLIIPYCW